MKTNEMQPIWIDRDGTKWRYEPMWEQCEFGDKPSEDFSEPSSSSCCEPVEYVGFSKEGQVGGLCRTHFQEIKDRSTVRFEEI